MPFLVRALSPLSRWSQIVACLVALLCAVSFSLQLSQLQSQTGALPVPAAAPAVPADAAIDAQLLTLFGVLRQLPELAPRELPLRLLACFVQADARQSSALIGVAGQPARRLRVGESLGSYGHVLAIEPRRVLLRVQGQDLWLGLQRQSSSVLLPAGEV